MLVRRVQNNRDESSRQANILTKVLSKGSRGSPTNQHCRVDNTESDLQLKWLVWAAHHALSGIIKWKSTPKSYLLDCCIHNIFTSVNIQIAFCISQNQFNAFVLGIFQELEDSWRTNGWTWMDLLSVPMTALELVTTCKPQVMDISTA